jgi:hypothetical protein
MCVCVCVCVHVFVYVHVCVLVCVVGTELHAPSGVLSRSTSREGATGWKS